MSYKKNNGKRKAQVDSVLRAMADPHLLKIVAHLAKVKRVETPFAVYDMEEDNGNLREAN